MSRSERSLQAQFRVGVLPLRIETGRYCNLKLEERICELCADNQTKGILHAFARLLKTYENSYFPEAQKPDCILIEAFLYFG